MGRGGHWAYQAHHGVHRLLRGAAIFGPHPLAQPRREIAQLSVAASISGETSPPVRCFFQPLEQHLPDDCDEHGRLQVRLHLQLPLARHAWSTGQE